MQLADVFDFSLVGRVDSPAIDYDRDDGAVGTLTFGEVDRRACGMAAVLTRRGVRRGDRVVLHLSNRVDFLDVFLACMKLGAVFVPVNVLYREREIAHIVADADPALCITSAEHVTLFPVSARPVSIGSLLDDVHRLGGAPPRARVALDGDDAAMIVYTSGTTGRSKGAVLSHNNCLANVANIVTCWQIADADRFLAVLPLFHVHGLALGVMSCLVSGCRMRLVERFDVHRAATLFRDFVPTLFFGVPTIYIRLLELPRGVAKEIGAHMRLFACGSAPLPAHVLTAFREAFGHTILERYGMSETLMNIGNPYSGERRAGTVGLPFPGVSVRIVDADGMPVPNDTVGELEVRGSNVFSGYWRNQAATAAAFRDGWFRTGDLAERSPDGYFTLRGRSTDLIISGGFNIYPREIEDVLLEVPGVLGAAVVGAPDARRGEIPIAYLVTDDPIDESRFRDICSRSLASFKVPRSFVRVDTLPRTALGKIQKHLLPAPPIVSE
ncbi:MAG: Long-chain-fatty-acid--CoA ligase [Gemmatimonadaceae bacterium]|nr:Long-chain-fatty-acid--CoA ligase [Gemmatimonadaceae bacterium]